MTYKHLFEWCDSSCQMVHNYCKTKPMGCLKLPNACQFAELSNIFPHYMITPYMVLSYEAIFSTMFTNYTVNREIEVRVSVSHWSSVWSHIPYFPECHLQQALPSINYSNEYKLSYKGLWSSWVYRILLDTVSILSKYMGDGRNNCK